MKNESHCIFLFVQINECQYTRRSQLKKKCLFHLSVESYESDARIE